MEKIDLIAAIRALKFDDPACIKELNDGVDKLHREFEDQAIRMTVRTEDLELAYSL